jgi:hypothetical protein
MTGFSWFWVGFLSGALYALVAGSLVLAQVRATRYQSTLIEPVTNSCSIDRGTHD